ncbi:MAG: Cu(I)-responsive transcriptional regulator [Hyphomicrobiaceae bacterium]|nr:Cu(I)-responsive transcriptional regulator [Hyphomicrobiaceae bacterium]
MNIGEAGQATRLPVKTLRYYEQIGLVRPLRQNNGYRDYSQKDVYKLRFLQRARSLGFTIEDCRLLLSLYEDDTRTSRQVKQVATRHLEEIERKITHLESLRGTLQQLIKDCHGDHRPDCPILEGLSKADKV